MEFRFSGIIDSTDSLYYLSDFVINDNIDKEYKNKFGSFDCMYARSKTNSGIYLLKLYYK